MREHCRKDRQSVRLYFFGTSLHRLDSDGNPIWKPWGESEWTLLPTIDGYIPGYTSFQEHEMDLLEEEVTGGAIYEL